MGAPGSFTSWVPVTGFVAKMRAAAVHDDTALAARNGETVRRGFERSKRAADSAGTMA